MTCHAATSPPSPRSSKGFAQAIEDRRQVGQTLITRAEIVTDVLKLSYLGALAAERARLALKPHDTPEAWVGNQFDWFTGLRWGQTPHHARGLAKRKIGGYWAIEVTGPAASLESHKRAQSEPGREFENLICEVGTLLMSMMDDAVTDPHLLECPVNAAKAKDLAPGVWELFVDTARDDDLAETTNGSFLAWCGALLQALM